MKKNKKNTSENIEEEKTEGVIIKIINFIRVISLAFVCSFLIYIFTIVVDSFTRIILLPFLLCACCLFWRNIAMIKNNDLMAEKLGKVYVLIFLLYWFGMIGFGSYTMISDGEDLMILALLPFILAGFYVIYDTFFKKR